MIRGVVYDLGCSDSHYKRFILENADSYVGVDWSNSLHDINADIIADLNDRLPIPDATADTVFSISTLEHLREPKIMLKESYRILKPGGKLIIQTPWQWHVHEAPFDYYRYSKFGLEYLIASSGFKNITVEPQFGFFSTIALKLNYFSERIFRGPMIVKILVGAIFIPLWTLTQLVGPIFDMLDRNWQAETGAYLATAEK